MGREWILVLALSSLIGVSAFNSWAYKVGKELQHWSEKYSASMAQTKNILTTKIINLASSQEFLDDVAEHQQNAVKGAIDRNLSSADIQEIRVLDYDCKLIGESSLTRFGVETCRSGKNRGFYWVKSPNGSILMYEHPSSGNFKLTAGVLIDRHWLLNYLGSRVEQAGFELTEHANLGIIANFSQPNEPKFIWSHWSNLFTRPFIGLEGSRIQLAPFAGFIVIITLFLVSQYRRKISGLANLIQKMEDEKKRALTPWNLSTTKKDWPEELNDRIQSKILHLEEEGLQLKQKLHMQNEVEYELKSELSDLQQSETVLEQVQRTLPSIIELIALWEKKVSAIESEISTVLVTGSYELGQLGATWKSDIESRGARKFLRSRLETEVAGDSGNQLNQELSYIILLASKVEHVGSRLQNNLLEIRKNQNSIKRMAVFWQSLLCGGAKEQMDWKFSDAIDDSFMQVKLASRDSNLRIQKPNWIEPLTNLNATYPIVTSMIHQVFSAFAKIDHDSLVDIQFRSGAIHDQIVFTLVGGKQPAHESMKSILERHINSANYFGRANGLILRQLPTLGSHIALAMAWRCTPVQNANERLIETQKGTYIGA